MEASQFKYMPLCMKFLNAKLSEFSGSGLTDAKLWLPAEGFDVGHISTSFFEPRYSVYRSTKMGPKISEGLYSIADWVKMCISQATSSSIHRPSCSRSSLNGIKSLKNATQLCFPRIKICFESWITLTHWESIESSLQWQSLRRIGSSMTRLTCPNPRLDH